MEKVRDFVTEYIQREYTISEQMDIMELNYIETGYIDSLGLVQFIATIEDEFAIEFTEDELENPDIKVVWKLIHLIEKKIDGREM